MNTSIWTAAAHGDVERVKRVVTKKGRRPDILDPHGYTPLHLAAQSENQFGVRPKHLRKRKHYYYGDLEHYIRL